ncbi:MAG TPA: serine hydrolase domain-containing protein [Solirubrobacterales bacterium]
MRSRTIVAAVWLVALCAVALPAGPAPASARATPEELQATLEDALRDTGAPGASAALVDDGELVWSGVAGERTLGGAPVAPGTRFITASAGKTVTAAMILRLADEGALSLGDRLAGYVPGIPGGGRIRIRNLLEHSSGLPDYLSSAEIWRTIQSEPAHEWTRGELFGVLGGLRFRPGSRVSYSNTNYVALGAVIEAVTGGSIEDAFHRLIAAPLGLTDSSWRYDPGLFDDGAHPYRERRDGGLTDAWDDGFVPTHFVGEVWTDGGLATTGADLARIANALVAGPLLSSRGRGQLLRFRERGFGRGIFRYRFDGRRIAGHDGLYEGFTAQHWTDPASGVTIAVLANLQARGADPSWEIWRRLARVATASRGAARG